jgi:hypothetical protein
MTQKTLRKCDSASIYAALRHLVEGVLGSLRESKGACFRAIVETKRDMEINIRNGPSETLSSGVFLHNGRQIMMKPIPVVHM